MTEKQFKSTTLFTGLSIYKNLENSNNYYVRIWVPRTKKYKVFTTGTTSLIEAKEIAKEHFKKLNLTSGLDTVSLKDSFEYWCNQYIEYRKNQTNTKPTNLQIDKNRLFSEKTGLCKEMGKSHIKDISNEHLSRFFKSRDEEEVLSNNTKNKYLSLLRAVLRFSFSQNAIARVPDFFKYDMKRRDNPRPSFHFDKTNDEYIELLKRIRFAVKRKETVRYQVITQDLYDLVLFLVHGYLRPTTSEIFSLKFKDIKVKKDPSSLEVRVIDGKTGFRISNSTKELVEIYEKLKKRNPNCKSEDYLFMPSYKNRNYVKSIFQKQFRYILEHSELLEDEYGQKRSLYSLRHLAIQMRLVNSGGKINLLWFAQNCGTSVEMIERFYSNYLPNSREVIVNLQSFADK